MGILKKYICVKQHDTKDCGVACLATVAKQYGLTVPISKIREAAGTDYEGTSAYGIIKAAEKLGLKSKGIRTKEYEDIFSDFPKPAIAHIVVDGTFLHYVVVHSADKHKIVIADPAKGIVEYKPEEFFKMWTGVIILLYPSDNFEARNESKGIVSRFINVLLYQKSLIFNIFISSILVTFLGIAGSFYFKFLLDDILPNGLKESLLTISIAMIVLALFKVVTNFLRSLLLIHMSQNIDISILLGYYKHVTNLPMSFFGTRKVGEIISRFNDASNIREAISSVTLTLMIDFLMAIVGGIILFNQSATMFWACFIPIILYLVLVVSFRKPLENANRQFMEDNAVLTSYLVESLQGIETVKAFNGEQRVNNETENRFIKFIKSVLKFSYTNNLQFSLITCIKTVFEIVILWIGAGLVLDGKISIGILISFNALLAYFIEPVERIISLQPQLQTAIVAAERLGEILDLEQEKMVDEDKKINPKSLLGNIEFKNVDFRYGTRKKILKNIDINIAKGEKIAFVGESGSGKTTIAKILMNFYDIESGEITINDYNIRDINKEVLRDKVSYISQESFFFSDTIKNNLKFGNPNASYEQIVEACKYAKIHEHINSLTLRYETMLEENASNLSGGQRQRLAIARALLRNPEILIMDEATSNLDSITEKAIENTIEICTKGITTIIIAHRLSTIMKCDKIYVIDKGEIIEAGNHYELMELNGYYSRLWNQQTSNQYDKPVAS